MPPWVPGTNLKKARLSAVLTRAEEVSGGIATTTQAFIQSNREFITAMAVDPRLFNQDAAVVEAALRESLAAKPQFDQLIVVDRDLKVIASYPKLDYQRGEPEGVEAEEITRTFQDGELRLASLPALREGSSAQIAFIQAIQGDNASPVRVLIGRSEFLDNPQGQLLLAALDDAQAGGMLVELIDENGYVIFHPSASQLMTRYFSITA